jgi:hypothetical protein
MSIQQTLRCSGEIVVLTDLNTSQAQKGRIVFVDKSNESRVIAGMRIFGTPQSRLLIDAYNSANGLAFRTNIDQGTTTEGGRGLPYAFEILPRQVNATVPTWIVEPNSAQQGPELGACMLEVGRYGTSKVPVPLDPSVRYIATFRQNTYQKTEQIQIGIGNLDYGHHTVYGFQPLFATNGAPLGGTSYLAHATSRNNEPLKCITWDQTGKVTIPGTITATTYENLPPVPPAQLLPLTLDKTNNRVGINQTNPVQALDVVGNGHFTGTLDVGNLAVQNSVIVVGDATFDGVVDARQDVNITKNLHVLGDTTLFRLGVVDSVSAYKYFSGSSFLVGGNSDPEGSVDGVPGSLYMRSDTGAVYVKTLPPGTTGWKELGSGSGDLTPITLDKTNNRVGINQTSPLQALDVTGNAHITGTLDVTDIVVENSLMVAGQGTFEGIFAVDDITCGTLHLGSIINSSKSNVLMYDTTTKEVSYGASPAPDLAPITLDKINNRVGINFATPSYTLGVGGDANLATGGVYRINGDRVLATKASGSTVIVGPTITVPDTSIQSVCIGTDSNVTTNCVSIGYNAGRISPGASTVAIGSEAGKTLQGNSSVAIGCLAGFTNQHANSIILNATGSALNSNGNSRFYVKPVRQDTAAPSLLGYDATTGEITYGVSKGVDVTSTTISFGNPGGSTSEYVNVTLATPGTYEITVEHWYTCNTPITVTSSMVYNCTEGTLSMTGFVASKKFVPSQTVSNLFPTAYAVNNKLLGNSVKFSGISAVSSNASFIITYTISNPQPIPVNTFTTYRKTTVVKLS